MGDFNPCVNNFVFTTKKILMKNHSRSCNMAFILVSILHITVGVVAFFFRFLSRMQTPPGSNRIEGFNPIQKE